MASTQFGFYVKSATLFLLAVAIISTAGIFLLNKFRYESILGSQAEADTNGSMTQASTPTSSAQGINLIGKPAPDFETELLNGEKLKLSDLKGQNVMLVFWATWCSWCARELPHLKEFHDANNENITIIALDRQEPTDIVTTYAKEKQINFTIAMDPDLAISNLYGVTGTPTHIYINKQGIVVKKAPGYEERVKMDKAIAELMNAKAN